MIFLVYTADHYHNLRLRYLARSLISQLEKEGDYNLSFPNDKTKSLSSLEPGQTLYIVGHGSRGSLTLSDLSAVELLELMSSCGFNPLTKFLNIILVSCHAGYKKTFNTPSFADEFYNKLTGEINSIEQHHRAKEGSLPKIIAPKHIIRYCAKSQTFIGIKQNNYQLCEEIKKLKPKSLSQWYESHAEPLTIEDFSTTNTLI